MDGFITPLRVENVDAKNWSVLDNFSWVGTKGDMFTVGKGSMTDFASVPWWSQAILPRTGTWTKAAVLHDKMCELLNQYYKLKQAYDNRHNEPGWAMQPEMEEPIKPLFSAVDTDAIFRKNARDGGTDIVRSELLWFGVRSGALLNPARHDGWMSTFPRYFADLVAILLVISFFVLLVMRVA